MDVFDFLKTYNNMQCLFTQGKMVIGWQFSDGRLSLLMLVAQFFSFTEWHGVLVWERGCYRMRGCMNRDTGENSFPCGSMYTDYSTVQGNLLYQ